MKSAGIKGVAPAIIAIIVIVIIAVAGASAYLLTKGAPEELTPGDNDGKIDNLPSGSDNQLPSNGSGNLYYHQVYSATSTDGINWTDDNTLVIDHASVPGAVYFNNKIYLYYINAADPGNEKLSVGISEDRGATFTSHDVNISGSNSAYPVDPNPIVHNNQIRLTYLNNLRGATNDIVTATSSDGINFTEDGVIFTKAAATDPDLFHDEVGGEWVLFVAGGQGLIKATASSPTTTFTEDTSFSWSAGALSSTHKIGAEYYTYYALLSGISVAEYSNGALSNIADGVVGGAGPTVVVFGSNDYKMFVKRIAVH